MYPAGCQLWCALGDEQQLFFIDIYCEPAVSHNLQLPTSLPWCISLQRYCQHVSAVICHYQGDYSNGTVTVSGDFTVMPYRCSKWDILQLFVILNAVQCRTVQYCTVLNLMFFNVQCSTVLYSTVRCSTVQCSTVQYSIIQYITVHCSTVQYNTVQYSAVE
jgi:hypothetical protein